MGFLQRMLSALRPTASPRALASRLQREAMERELTSISKRDTLSSLVKAIAGYDGAARGHRTSGRPIGWTSADREIWSAHRRLVDVSRELTRNNVYAAKAVAGITSNVVGAGIKMSVHGPGKRVKERLQALIEDHLESLDIDFDGRNNIYGLQALAMRSVVESGEVLIVRYRRKSSDGLKLPYQIRIMEGDYLCTLMDAKSLIAPIEGNFIQSGIEFDRDGRRVAYHLYKNHPGALLGAFSSETVRVPAEDVIHLYRQDRPGQSRGVPWGAPCVLSMWDLADYEEAELMRQKIAACFAIFWVDSEGRTRLGGDKDAPSTDTGLPTQMLEPGLQQRLPPGVDVKFATPPSTASFEPFIRSGVRKIAVGYGIPYEVISGDYSQVNFSSGRMGWLEFQRSIDQWQWNMFIPHFCVRTSNWFLEAAEFAVPGAIKARIRHTEPRREMIDPTKEIPAARDAIRAGLSSRSEEMRRLGYDPEKVEVEIADENKRADDLKLKFDSDGRYAMNAPMTDTSRDGKLPGDPKPQGD